ncbi:AsnC family protein [Candidatus Thorarchaeota archaeon]|nr:MAG: AsnC family protein [Candidatus Thorarchaeota archaeon]
MSKLQSISNEFWKASSKTIFSHFGLESPSEPRRVSLIDSMQQLRFGGQYDIGSGELQVTQEVIEDVIPLEGLIHRECLFHTLPLELCYESKRDIATCFAYALLGKNERERWISYWKKIPSQRIRANLTYNSFETMDWMYRLGGYDELAIMIHEIESMNRYGKHFVFEEYVEYMTRRTQDIVVGLSQTDIRILDTLLTNPDISYREIGKLTKLSESWVSTKINELKNRYVLVELTTTPFSRIGIRTFHVLLSSSAMDDPTRFIKGCPFLYDVRSILSGPWQVLGRLAVPDNIDNTKALDQMISILQRNGIGVDVSETYSVGVTNSFYHYNTMNCQWDIPWIAMESWGYRIQNESLYKLIDRIDIPTKTTDYYLDHLDMRILEQVHQGLGSTRSLRSKLSIGQNKLSRRVRTIRNQQLIRTTWAVYNIGLVERVALRTTDKVTSEMLDAWSRELPRSYLRFEDNRNLLLMIELPSGGLTKLMDVLRKLKWPVTISPLGSGVWGQWEFPKRLWDVDKQRWNSPVKEIRNWLNALVIECEDTDDNMIDTRRHFLQTR